MTPAIPRRSPEEVARLGDDIFERLVRPTLTSDDDGKYVAIDIETEDYEIDDNDYAALTRLTDRRRGGTIWIVRINKPYKISFRMRFGK